MTKIARYVIVLDRYDDDDWAKSEGVEDGHDGTAEAACAQVAAELQEAMTEHGTPAGFFNVIERRTSVSPDERVTQVNADHLAKSLGIERLMENDEGANDG